ncbi:hypothetical protein BX600DRAFT_509731 [Xylariales sp. PMI_506]|nr:hypothetical protein BX600DRAFT_509731 [Xylariales sp. PMI_506]
MAYSHFQHQNSMAPVWFPATVDPIANSCNIDPDLENNNIHSFHNEPWTPHHIMTYQRSFTAVLPTSDMRRMNGTIPLPSAFAPRQGSPSDQFSSDCSSSLSHHGESDHGRDNTPLTPRDDITLSPPQAWAYYDQSLPLPGLTSDCMKLTETNFYPEPFTQFSDERNPEFPARGLSMSSHGSSYDFNTSQHEQIPHMPRQMSPVEMSPAIKAEICIPEFSHDIYPPLDAEDDGGMNQSNTNAIAAECNPLRSTPKRASLSANKPSRGRKRAATAAAAGPQQESQLKSVKLEPSSSPNSAPLTKSTLQGAKGTFPCNECRDIVFTDESGLQKHIKQQHTRPFVCVFNWAGCDSTFASKNEWKRHVASQHLLLNYWLCQQEGCAKNSNSGPGSDKQSTTSSRNRASSDTIQPQINCAPVLPSGVIFNRKDLYTQHVRRMHVPLNVKKQVKQKKTVPEWESHIRTLQSDALKLRCDLPDYMECPSSGCSTKFRGPTAWDDRMEHVARHLEKAATNSNEGHVQFGGPGDPTLTNWATRPDVAVVKAGAKGTWVLHNPLKPDKGVKPQASPISYGDEDAEGEAEDL